MQGIISKKPLGTKGFHYDPIFIPNNNNKTYAEMTFEEKNQISHRGQAIKKLITYLSS